MKCQCQCGQVKTIDLAHLRDGHTASCGCLRDENSAEMARTNPLIAQYRKSDLLREQMRQRALRHGLSRHAHYGRWLNMLARCENPEHQGYKNYGGRGIRVCPEWHDMAVFIAWIEENLGPCPDGMSLDRINNNGNYEPGNVRWATQVEQVRNSRGIKAHGEQHYKAKLTVAAAAEIRRRYAAGGVTQRALGREFGVDVGTVSSVIRGRTWRQRD